MKKMIAMMLLAVLCLSLCSCGVDEKYTALLENLDAGDYVGIKSEMMILSPDFKAEQEQMAADRELLEKYGSLLELLEAEDYEGALADLVSRVPEPPKPASTEVEITMDNWSEYFEIRECPVADPFGRLHIYAFIFVPKAEYMDRIDYDAEFTLDISHIDTYQGEYYYSFDAQTNAFSYLDAKYQYTYSHTNVTSVNDYALKMLAENNGEVSYENMPTMIYGAGVFEDIVQKYELEIDNIRGSIYILD